MVSEHGFEFALGKASFIFENFQKNPRGIVRRVLKHHVRVVSESHRQHKEEHQLKIDMSPKSGSQRRGA